MYAVCRLCLGKKIELLNVFESKIMPEWTLADVIKELLRLQVSDGDKYPQSICIECMEKLKAFRRFKQQCEQNKDVLDLRFAENRGTVEHEDVAETVIHCNDNRKDVNLKQEDLKIRNEEDRCYSKKRGNEIAMETEVCSGKSNEKYSAKELESANQISFPIENEFGDNLNTVETDHSSTKAAKLTKISEDGRAESMKNNGIVIPQRSRGPSYSNKNISGPSSSWSVDGNKGHQNVLTSARMKCVSGNKVRAHVLYPFSSNPALSTYSCDVCGKVFAQTEVMEAHLGSHTAVKTFKCKLCHRGFHLNDSLVNHKCVNKVQSVQKPLVCCWCDEEFNDLAYLQRHELLHAGHLVFECNRCKMSFHEIGSLEKHLFDHSQEERQYDCDICHNSFTQKSSLKMHMNIHSFSCHVCHLKFYKERNLEKHMSVHLGENNLKLIDGGVSLSQESNSKALELIRPSDGDGSYRCVECNKTLLNRATFHNHMKRHRLCRKYECPMCGVTFPFKQTQKMHMMTHFSGKSFKCDICNKLFYRRCDLNKHKTKHSDYKQFKCPYCGKEFHLKSCLKSHLVVHSNEKHFKCSECTKAFNRRRDLNIHLMKHSGKTPFECKECGKPFYRNYDLKMHMITHTGNKPFACTKCHKAFSQNVHLKIHMFTHSGDKPFNCAECGKDFSVKQALKCHIKLHFGDKPFSCETCSKAFSTKLNLRRHKITHSDAKPFECNDCGQVFSRKCYLKSHKLTHSTEKAFGCLECGRRFSKKGVLMSHVLTHSRNKPFGCTKCEKRFFIRGSLNRHMKSHL